MSDLILRLRFRWIVSRRLKRIADICKCAEKRVGAKGLAYVDADGMIWTGQEWRGGRFALFGYFLIPMADLLMFYPLLKAWEAEAQSLLPRTYHETVAVREAMEEIEGEAVPESAILLRSAE
jgi:hypothetical protein